jgi:hypothetical protein
VNGIELNFIRLLREFKIYIQGEMLLPMILVRNQIRNMLGGETGKITFGRINYNLGLGAKEFRFVYIILVQCVGTDFKVIGIKFMILFIVRRDAACF